MLKLEKRMRIFKNGGRTGKTKEENGGNNGRKQGNRKFQDERKRGISCFFAEEMCSKIGLRNN